MKILKSIVISIFFLSIIFIFPNSIFASNYGEGRYGSSDYGKGDSNSASVDSTSNNGVSVCNDSPSSGVPDLFEIKTNKNSATLYFSPPPMPYSNFYIAYSRKSTEWEYGTQYNQGKSGGVLSYTIRELQPNTKYYFKIRSGNGCAVGGWSNTLYVVTSSSLKQKTFYKNKVSEFYQQIKSKIGTLFVKTNQDKGTSSQQMIQTSEPTIPQKVINNIPVKTYSPVVQVEQKKSRFCIFKWCF